MSCNTKQPPLQLLLSVRDYSNHHLNAFRIRCEWVSSQHQDAVKLAPLFLPHNKSHLFSQLHLLSWKAAAVRNVWLALADAYYGSWRAVAVRGQVNTDVCRCCSVNSFSRSFTGLWKVTIVRKKQIWCGNIHLWECELFAHDTEPIPTWSAVQFFAILCLKRKKRGMQRQGTHGEMWL